MIPPYIKVKHNTLPMTPGVYRMEDARGKVCYIGKAANLKRRVTNYFTRPHDGRIEKLMREVRRIDYTETDSTLEALILEARLIKEHEPPYNIREKDDQSFLFVEITRDPFPRVLLVRGKSAASGTRFGPFTSASSIREALRIIRKIFPFSTHRREQIGALQRPCFEHEIGLCPGACVGAINRTTYKKNIKNITRLFQGKKRTVVRGIETEMKKASTVLDFERAAQLKRQIFSLKHIQDIALIGDELRGLATRNLTPVKRIEGYDVSNISGTFAVGAMVVFRDTVPDRAGYRKFKIRTVTQPNDIAMLREVLGRRLTHREWSLPDLILVDGGRGQVRAAEQALSSHGLKLPIVGIAKGPKRKRNDFVGSIPHWVSRETLIRVRDEAHRFAIAYHRKSRDEYLPYHRT